MKFSFYTFSAALSLLLLTCGNVMGAREVESPGISEVVREFFPEDAEGGLAVLVIRDGKVIHKKGYGLKKGKYPITSDTRMGIASISKQFAAMCAAFLIEEGKLSLDDKVSMYLPDLDFSDKGRELLVSDLVWHTSGLVNFVKRKERKSIEEYKEVHGLSHLNNLTHAEWLAEQPLKRRPGIKWEYTNSGYVLLARIIEVITEEPFHVFQQKRIFDKLRMSDTTDSKRFNGSGNMVTTLNDYEKWDRALWEGTLLEGESAKLLFKSGTLDNGGKVDYGFGWKLSHDNDGQLIEVHHGGAGNNSRSFVLRDLSNRITVVFFGRENLSLTLKVRMKLAWALRDQAL